MSDSLVITYRRADVSGPALFLEQDEPDAAGGVVTAGIVVSNLLGSILGGDVLAPSCAGVVDGIWQPTIYVYPDDPLMDYRFGLSWGEHGVQHIEEVTIPEIVSFTMTTEYSLKYPSKRIISQEWLGDCYDAKGNIITTPQLTVDGQLFTSSQPCYGSLLVKHRVIRHRYDCTIDERENAKENALSSIAWAVWQDGHGYLALDVPDGESDSGSCGGANLDHIPPDQRRYVPKFAWANRETDVNYCSQVPDEPTITGHEEWGWERA